MPGKPGVSRMTVFRMTPVNDTNLLNKDTGDAAGDIAFTLMEMSMPMFCRHGGSLPQINSRKHLSLARTGQF